MIFDQIGGSFELAKQIGEIFINFFLGYVPRSAFYCILMVSYLHTPFSTGAPGVAIPVCHLSHTKSWLEHSFLISLPIQRLLEKSTLAHNRAVSKCLSQRACDATRQVRTVQYLIFFFLSRMKFWESVSSFRSYQNLPLLLLDIFGS